MIEAFKRFGFVEAAPEPFGIRPGETYLKRTLFGDYYAAVLLVPSASSPTEAADRTPQVDCTIYLGCSRFSAFMDIVEPSDGSVGFGDYLARKMRKDRWGTLAFGQVGQRHSTEREAIFSGGVTVDLDDLGEAFSRLKKPGEVRDFIYRSEIGRLLADIETFWVYSFLSFEAGDHYRDLVAATSNSENLLLQRRSWKFKRELDLGTLSALEDAYRRICQ